jgi:hypothetical protein
MTVVPLLLPDSYHYLFLSDTRLLILLLPPSYLYTHTVKKYAVDQPIKLQLAPYEERLAKALEKEEVARRKAEEMKNKAKKT